MINLPKSTLGHAPHGRAHSYKDLCCAGLKSKDWYSRPTPTNDRERLLASNRAALFELSPIRGNIKTRVSHQKSQLQRPALTLVFFSWTRKWKVKRHAAYSVRRIGALVIEGPGDGSWMRR